MAEGRAAAAALAAAARGPAPAAAAVAADEFGVDEDFVVELDDDMSRSTSTLGGDAEACPSTTTDGAQEAASGGTGMQPGAAGLGAAVLAAEQMAAAAAPGGATAGGAKAHRLTKFPLALAEELLALVKVSRLPPSSTASSRSLSCASQLTRVTPTPADPYRGDVLLPGPRQAAPPGEFDTQRTTKMWALEQLLRWCAAHEEKLVVVGERYMQEPRSRRAAVLSELCLWGLETLSVLGMRLSAATSHRSCFASLPCSLEFLREVERLLDRAALRLPGAAVGVLFVGVWHVVSCQQRGVPAHGPQPRCEAASLPALLQAAGCCGGARLRVPPRTTSARSMCRISRAAATRCRPQRPMPCFAASGCRQGGCLRSTALSFQGWLIHLSPTTPACPLASSILPALQVFLLSKAGTHGINLVSCRRIVVLEEPWNPVYNLQAIARLFRYGQAHGTFVYRMYFNGAVQVRCTAVPPVSATPQHVCQPLSSFLFLLSASALAPTLCPIPLHCHAVQRVPSKRQQSHAF